MRFAPPPSVGMKTKTGGLNQISVRSFNERLVLSLLRQYGALSRQELGKKSGLSAQTISVIVRALEKDGMILPGEKQRGRVGPPTIPMALNPEGAFAVGIELGHSEARLAEVDFTGHIRSLSSVVVPGGSSSGLLDSLTGAVGNLIEGLSDSHRDRLVGIGVAMPTDIPPEDAELGEEIESRLSTLATLPVILQNDVTCAASAEVSFGEARLLDDFIYFFLDTAIGCRLVLGGHIFSGRAGTALSQANSGDLASLSRFLLFSNDPSEFWPHSFEWDGHSDAIATWSEGAADELVSTIKSALAFVDAKTVVVDARLPSEVTQALVSGLEKRLIDEPEFSVKVVQGAVGASAKAIGAANLSLNQAYMVQEST